MPDRAVRRRTLQPELLVDAAAIDELVDGSGAGAGTLSVEGIGAGTAGQRGSGAPGSSRYSRSAGPVAGRAAARQFSIWPAVRWPRVTYWSTPLPDRPVAWSPISRSGSPRRSCDTCLMRMPLPARTWIVQAEMARKRGSRGRGTLPDAGCEPGTSSAPGRGSRRRRFARGHGGCGGAHVTRRSPPLVTRVAAGLHGFRHGRVRGRAATVAARWRCDPPVPVRESRAGTGFRADARSVRRRGPVDGLSTRGPSSARAGAAARPVRGAGPRAGSATGG